MTQIISVITHDSVILTTDSLLTTNPEPNVYKLYSDRECKLVLLCHQWVIGYAGMARLGANRVPTHEWIAKTLVIENCQDPIHAGEVLTREAPKALPNYDPKYLSQYFVISGWGDFGTVRTRLPFITFITNRMNEKGQHTQKVQPRFAKLSRILKPEETAYSFWCGTKLKNAKTFARNNQKVARRHLHPREHLRLVKEAILNTARNSSTVNEKLLSVCIPKNAVARNLTLAAPLGQDVASFVFLDPDRNEWLQFGPTFVCGENAFTDFTSGVLPDGENSGFLKFRILHQPPQRG